MCSGLRPRDLGWYSKGRDPEKKDAHKWATGILNCDTAHNIDLYVRRGMTHNWICQAASSHLPIKIIMKVYASPPKKKKKNQD